MRSLPRLNPILPFEEDAAGPGSKSSLKGGHEDPGRALEWADVRPPTFEESPTRALCLSTYSSADGRRAWSSDGSWRGACVSRASVSVSRRNIRRYWSSTKCPPRTILRATFRRGLCCSACKRSPSRPRRACRGCGSRRSRPGARRQPRPRAGATGHDRESVPHRAGGRLSRSSSFERVSL